MTTMSLTTSEAKEDFAELINRVAHNKERIILVRRGKEVAVIVPIEDLLLLETSQNKSDLQDATDALQEARSTGMISLEELKAEIGEQK